MWGLVLSSLQLQRMRHICQSDTNVSSSCCWNSVNLRRSPEFLTHFPPLQHSQTFLKTRSQIRQNHTHTHTHTLRVKRVLIHDLFSRRTSGLFCKQVSPAGLDRFHLCGCWRLIWLDDSSHYTSRTWTQRHHSASAPGSPSGHWWYYITVHTCPTVDRTKFLWWSSDSCLLRSFWLWHHFFLRSSTSFLFYVFLSRHVL